MKIGYVCTNYNNSGLTRGAISSLLAGHSADYEIVVVDNNSNAASIEELRGLLQDYPGVKLIFNAENIGYFSGLNCGIRHLRATRPDIEHIVVGNNDLVFPSDFAERVCENLPLFREYAVISPDVTTVDGIHQNPYVISRISKIRELLYDLYYSNYCLAMAIMTVAKLTSSITARGDQGQHQVARQIYMGHGSCYVLGPLFFRHFSELWAPSFLMAEENFLSEQLSARGLHIFYAPSIKVTHHYRATINQIPSRKLWKISRDAHRLRRRSRFSEVIHDQRQTDERVHA